MRYGVAARRREKRLNVSNVVNYARKFSTRSVVAISRKRKNSCEARPARQGILRLRRSSNANDDVALVENALATARNLNAERSTSLRVLMKLGPAFGLMGTLIPLGPALVGLASGDLETLAHNLMIAFSTTVVGLTVSSLAFLAATFRKRFATRDAILTTFAASRILDAVEARNAETRR